MIVFFYIEFFPFHFSKESSDVAVSNSEQEDGEIDETEGHPMVTLTKIDPKDIPEVSNKYLMRGIIKKEDEGELNEENGDVKEEKDKSIKRERGDRRKDHDRSRDGKETKNKYSFYFKIYLLFFVNAD